MLTVSMNVNGNSATHEVPDNTLLVTFLRETLGLTGTHVGCDTSQCGACIVHLNGESVKSCSLFAAQADGATITTIEGINTNMNTFGLKTSDNNTSNEVLYTRVYMYT